MWWSASVDGQQADQFDRRCDVRFSSLWRACCARRLTDGSHLDAPGVGKFRAGGVASTFIPKRIRKLEEAVASRTSGPKTLLRVVVEAGADLPTEAPDELLMCRHRPSPHASSTGTELLSRFSVTRDAVIGGSTIRHWGRSDG
jgi:hypothetical protein